MPITTTLDPEIWQPATRWIRECQQMGIPIQSTAFDQPRPFINPEAEPGIEQLLAKSKRQRKGGNLTLKLTQKQAIGLMDQFDMWAHEEFRLPGEYRRIIPRDGPSSIFKMVSMEIENAIDAAEPVRR